MPVQELPSWAPSVGDVALRLLSRTRQANGVLAKTFNSQTQPTDTDVTSIIAQQVHLLRPRLGEVPDRLADSAQALLALKSAIVVEGSYFSEQIQTDMSPYRGLVAEYMQAMKDWDEAARGEEPGGQKITSMAVGTLYPGYATGTF